MSELELNPAADDHVLIRQVVDFYHQTLKDTTEALTYLQSRGITNSEVIDHFQIGYANRTLGLKLPSNELKAGREIRSRLQALGIYRGSGHEHLCGSVVFPIIASDGRILDLYGRKIRKDLRKGTPLDTYLGEQRHGIWNYSAFQASNEIILCGSLFDGLTLWNHGFRNVSCCFNETLDDHLKAFQVHNTKRVIITNEAIAPRILETGCDCFLLKLPSHLDINTYALQMPDAADALGSLVRKAEWLGNGKPTEVVSSDSLGMNLDEVEQSNPKSQSDFVGEINQEPIEPMTSVVPRMPKDIEAEVHDDEIIIQSGHRRYRVRGLSRNLAFDSLKVNVLATTDKGMYVDTFDLYSAKHRQQFVVQAAAELGVDEQVVKKDLGKVLLKLEELQDEIIAKATKPTSTTMTSEEQEEALLLLRDPDLLGRIVEDLSVVGEGINKLVGYLATVSRKLDQPLAVIIQSSSSAGKTSLMDAVLDFVPPEDQVKLSAMTGQSLYYMGSNDLKNKILAIAEDEGAERASYALKILQSEGKISIASTGKDSTTGRLVAQEYRVEGPVMLFLSTTSIHIDEELLNRCIVLSVDENREQTKAIHRHQQTLEGLLANHDRERVLAVHRNAQRLLRPLMVANPYAEKLTFSDDKIRTRRDHLKYLTGLLQTLNWHWKRRGFGV